MRKTMATFLACIVAAAGQAQQPPAPKPQTAPPQNLPRMPSDDRLPRFAAAKKFVQKQMTKSDLMAIMMFAGAGVQVLVDFTADRDKLLSTIETLIVGEDQNAIDDSQADTGAAFGQE